MRIRKVTVSAILIMMVWSVIAAASQSPKFFIDRGLKHYQRKEFEKAHADFTEALRIIPSDNNVGRAAAHSLLGMTYIAKGHYDKAIEEFNKALPLFPPNEAVNKSNAYQQRGTAYSKKKDYAKAIADYEMAVKTDPNNQEAKMLVDLTKSIQSNPISSECTSLKLRMDVAVAGLQHLKSLLEVLTSAGAPDNAINEHKGKILHAEKTVSDLKIEAAKAGCSL